MTNPRQMNAYCQFRSGYSKNKLTTVSTECPESTSVSQWLPPIGNDGTPLLYTLRVAYVHVPAPKYAKGALSSASGNTPGNIRG
jgi:hypothetical protein